MFRFTALLSFVLATPVLAQPYTGPALGGDPPLTRIFAHYEFNRHHDQVSLGFNGSGYSTGLFYARPSHERTFYVGFPTTDYRAALTDDADGPISFYFASQDVTLNESDLLSPVSLSNITVTPLVASQSSSDMAGYVLTNHSMFLDRFELDTVDGQPVTHATVVHSFYGTSAANPEPSCALLLMLGIGILASGRRGYHAALSRLLSV